MRGKRQRQGELCLLAAGHLPRPLAERDAEIAEALLRIALVEAAVEVAGHVDEVACGEVLVKRRVLGHKRDSVERGQRTGAVPAEHC